MSTSPSTAPIIPVAEGLWVVLNDVFLPGGLHFPGRMTVVRLADGGLLLHSPTPIDDALAASLDALGPVTHIVAPNGFHHLYLKAASERYPKARVYGVPILANKKRKDVRFDAMLGAEPEAAWREVLDQLRIEGVPKIDEVVFFHRASGTLILTDLIFNLQEVKNRRTRWVLKLMRAWGRPRQSRMWRWLTKDRAAAAASVQRMLEWPIERVYLAHGEPLEGPDVVEELREALTWMLRAAEAPRRLSASAPPAQ